jgi:hypothetical protein
MRWAGHLARTVRGGLHKAFWWENLTERKYFEDPRLDKKIII